MGLTANSTGKNAYDNCKLTEKRFEDDIIVALAGNPNVGKSTVFNALTGLNQHTGNWPGKTVAGAKGHFTYKNMGCTLVDTPGCYSLNSRSCEEAVTKDFILSGKPDAIVVVCDACCLQRNLILALQIMQITKKVIICVNMLDEAKKKKVDIDLYALEQALGVTVVGITARDKKGLDRLKQCIFEAKEHKKLNIGDCFYSGTIPEVEYAQQVANKVVNSKSNNNRDSKIDRIVAGKIFAFPIMLVMVAIIFWITIVGANYPSQILSEFFLGLEQPLYNFLISIKINPQITSCVVFGVYRVVAWIVSVMLPPMAIFFPIFTLLEDLGYLPRVAFNVDRCFKKCNTCGKQALTMCMGFGCNAAGVVGCRIIESDRERLIAILTNSFIPCNGRFPILISVISMFFIVGFDNTSFLSAIYLTLLIVLSVTVTLIISKLLSLTLLKGQTSSFTLELPPYRRPQFLKVIVRSLLDRTIYVLGRALISAIPAGFIIWILANLSINDQSLLLTISSFLDPFARAIGLDGVILFAFILGIPANEIVIPLIIMAYTAKDALISIENLDVLKQLLVANGWTWVTAVCLLIFTIFHWPCATTLLTIKKETNSMKWTVISFVLPMLIGISLCFLINLLSKLII